MHNRSACDLSWLLGNMQLEANFPVPDINMASEDSTEINVIASGGCFMAADNKLNSNEIIEAC